MGIFDIPSSIKKEFYINAFFIITFISIYISIIFNFISKIFNTDSIILDLIHKELKKLNENKE